MEINNALDLYFPVPRRVQSTKPFQPLLNTHTRIHIEICLDLEGWVVFDEFKALLMHIYAVMLMAPCYCPRSKGIHQPQNANCVQSNSIIQMKRRE